MEGVELHDPDDLFQRHKVVRRLDKEMLLLTN